MQIIHFLIYFIKKLIPPSHLDDEDLKNSLSYSENKFELPNSKTFKTKLIPWLERLTTEAVNARTKGLNNLALYFDKVKFTSRDSR